jgi:hypothetical protein
MVSMITELVLLADGQIVEDRSKKRLRWSCGLGLTDGRYSGKQVTAKETSAETFPSSCPLVFRRGISVLHCNLLLSVFFVSSDLFLMPQFKAFSGI